MISYASASINGCRLWQISLAILTAVADFISFNSCGNNITLFYTPGVVQFPGRNFTLE